MLISSLLHVPESYLSFTPAKKSSEFSVFMLLALLLSTEGDFCGRHVDLMCFETFGKLQFEGADLSHGGGGERNSTVRLPD